MSSSNTNTNSNNNNKKVLYQLWTDGRGSFAVRKEEGIQLFEYSHSQQSYSKVNRFKIALWRFNNRGTCSGLDWGAQGSWYSRRRWKPDLCWILNHSFKEEHKQAEK